MKRWASAFWTLAAAIAVLWPSRFIGPLEGVPLDTPSDAIVLGLLLPSLWWLSRQRCRLAAVKLAIVALLLWKAGTGLVAQQQGLCMTAVAPHPLAGTAMTMRIDEPLGFLRSWDLRADLWIEQPSCTAIVTRPLEDAADVPAWFVNITDQMIGRRDFALRFTGSVDIGGRPIAINETVAVTGEAMRFVPEIEGQSVFGGAVFSGEPGGLDRLLAPWAWSVAPLLCLVLIGALATDGAKLLSGQWALWGWIAFSNLAALALALFGNQGWQRAAGALTLGAVFLPLRTRVRNVRGAFLLVGLPWLVFFAAKSFEHIGRFSIYSTDDWLAYQVAGYRIFINGFWLEAGSLTFDYQPLYRWISGGLHLIFGDSSVGEVYWDATCLLIGALLAFQIVRATVGFRAGIVAAALALATFTLGTPWHFFGRGLSEISAAGFAFLAMCCLLRARAGARRWLLAGTAMAILMFLSRLNHMLWVAFLPAMLLPLRTPMALPALWRSMRSLRVTPVVTYAAAFTAAISLFMTRTWYYTGDFSLFYGTSLRHNDTGLRPSTLLDATAWQRVWHSLQSFGWMNEPPEFDLRAIVMVAGLLIGAAALLQVPIARRLPAALVLSAAGSIVGSFFAHAHGYPGRFSIHAVPLASAMAVIAATRAWPR